MTVGPDVMLETDVGMTLTGIPASQFGAQEKAALTRALQSAFEPYNIQSVAIESVSVRHTEHQPDLTQLLTCHVVIEAM